MVISRNDSKSYHSRDPTLNPLHYNLRDRNMASNQANPQCEYRPSRNLGF